MLPTKIVEKMKTHILGSMHLFLFENYAVYEIIWKSILEPGMPQMIIRLMRIACCIPQTTETH